MDESDLLYEFVEESRDHLADIEAQLLQIEAYGADINDDLVNTVFRAIHSTKGAAGFLGLTQINEVAHRLENVLNNVRDHKLVPDPFNVDIMLKSADSLRNMIEEVESSNDADNSEIIAKLDEILNGGSGRPSESGQTAAAADDAAEAAPVAATQSLEAAEASVNEAIADQAENVAAQDATAETEIPETAEPSVGEESPAVPTPPAAAAPPAPAPVAPPVPTTARSTAKAKSPADATSKKSGGGESTIRVGVRVLDRLMNLAGELVLSRNQLLRVLSERGNSTPLLDGIASGMDQVTTELQETIMQTRMQPIGNVFGKFPRIIRDLSGSLGKQINLSMEGTEVEVDKTIVEAIADPLTHLIRNSCDHGIETPDVRLAAGKDGAGEVLLRAYHQAGKVMIEIADDGAGMDPARIKENAVKKGVLTPEAAEEMNDVDAVNLIFAPGFSTAAQVTAISGRGVGMDVVRTNIEAIGGSVEVKSVFGEGSTIQITLPLTLAIVPSMIVLVGDQRYALPQSSIVELVRTDGVEKRIENVSNAEVLRLRGKLIPLVRLRETLRISGTDEVETDGSARNHDQLVVVESGRSQFAMAVDRVLDSEEIVVKPLGKHLSNLPLLAGATILGDGRIAMILDTAGVAHRVALSNDASDEPNRDQEDEASEVHNGKTRLVLVGTSKSDKFAVPMDLVSRIERIRADEVDVIGNRSVVKYRGSTLPLVSIDEVVDVKAVESPKNIYVIVFDISGMEVGLVVPQLSDIREVDLSNNATAQNQPGVAGIIVIDDETTRLLDLYGLCEAARPEWLMPPKNDGADNSDTRILVVEDSKMFRSFLINTLREEGYQVADVEDGRFAADLLAEDSDFDIIVTDIEMPNMDGIELTEHIRDTPHLKSKPIIALTSRTDDETRQRGIRAGVDDYQVKMNKPELLACVAEYKRTEPRK